jgi:hypothetical protein
MRWEGGNVSVSHSRAPWGPSGDEWTFVNGRIDQVNGNNRDYGDLKRDYYRTYLAAKHEFGMKSAYEIIDRCVKPEVVTSLAQVVSKLDPRPMLIFPHPAFDDEEGVDGKKPLGAFPNNALPRKQPSRRSTKSFHPPPLVFGSWKLSASAPFAGLMAGHVAANEEAWRAPTLRKGWKLWHKATQATAYGLASASRQRPWQQV